MNDFYESYIKTKDGKLYTPSIMGETKSIKQLIDVWGLNNDDVEWCVVFSVVMHLRDAKDEPEAKLGYGFDYEYSEMYRNGNVPEDFSVERYSNVRKSIIKK